MGTPCSPSMSWYGSPMLITAGQNIGRRMVAAAGLKSGDHVVCPVEDPDAFYGVERYRGAGLSRREGPVVGRYDVPSHNLRLRRLGAAATAWHDPP